MLVMVVFFIAFRWIHLSTPLIRLFLLVLILLLMPTLNFLPVWFALSLLRFRLPSRLPMMFILWMVAMMVVIIPSRDRKSGSAGKECLFGGGQKAASGGIQGDVLATDNNTVGMGDAGIKSAIQGSNVPNPDEAVPSFVSGAMAKA